ncbi:exonuclease domain-containing protein [Salinispirillum sp. LH 10-3-1]|uniref:Exonuclease domain-containing protein n=1 Tax=Salinispirillum sp. LH 10-3-1 TaxID=2952525 RepID=A0AB38YFT9_9GAMM
MSHSRPLLYDRALLAIDLEMSGLNPKTDRILSLGCVPITQDGIPLGQAQHWLFRCPESVAQSATIHHLRDCDLHNGGADPEQVLPELLQRLKGHVLVTHGGDIDADFLNQAHLRYWGQRWRPTRMDTQDFARRRLGSEHLPTANNLSLRHCRQHYHLPAWRAHHALSDAIATAELFQAQLQDAFPEQDNPQWRSVHKSFSNLWMRLGIR